MFVFTEDGKASVQVMYLKAQTGSAYAQGGYEASYGSYRIDSSSTFKFHIEGALVRTLIGRELKRAYEISGGRLTVKSTDPNEHRKVVWENIGAADMELTADELQDIERAASNVSVQGERYPEHIEQ